MKKVHVNVDKEAIVVQTFSPPKGEEFATLYRPNKDSGVDCSGEPSRTHQSFAGECDINDIVRKGLQSGHWPDGRGGAHYGDFSDLTDYRAAMDIVLEGRSTFESLPAEVRRRFGNDPAAFFEFATDPKNAQALVDMGLATPVAAPTADVVPEAAAAAKPAEKPPVAPKGEKL